MCRTNIIRTRPRGPVWALLTVAIAYGPVTAAAGLTAPSHVAVAGSSESRVDVYWQDNSSNETGFEVHRSITGPNGPFMLLASTAAQGVTYADAGLNPSTTYCYKLRAFRVAGSQTTYSAFSTAGCAMTLPAAPPLPPFNVQSATASHTAINVSWQHNSTTESGFQVFRSTTGPDGPFTWLAFRNRDTRSLIDNGLSPSTQYCYNVRAIRDVGGVFFYSQFSNTACATTASPPARSQLEINTSTAGVDLDTDGYSLQVWRVVWGGYIEDMPFTTLPATGSITISGLVAADYLLRLHGIAVNCEVQGANPTRITFGPPWEPPPSILFEVTCVPPTQIAFADTSDGNSEIFVVNSNGTGVRRLTMHPANDAEPAWSPDGTRIAFRSDRDGADEIYVMNADGSNPERLTHTGGRNVRPAWSPDGTKIAFTSYRDGNGEVYVMNADGSGLVNITNHAADDEHPSWSPDGSRIAFGSTRDHPFGYSSIFMMAADGSAVVRLSTDLYSSDRQPAWSPDGTWLAVARMSETRTISLINLVDGSSGVWTVPGDPWWQSHTDPVWSPDGRSIAFTEGDGYYPDEVRVVRLDQVSVLTNGVRLAPGFHPSWRRR